MKYLFIILCFVLVMEAKDYSKDTKVQAFITSLIQEYGMQKVKLDKLFAHVQVYKVPLRMFAKKSKTTHKPSTPKSSHKRKIKHGTWEKYSRFKFNKTMVYRGVQFIKKYQKIFDTVEKTYGVPSAYIAAIIGIETMYGRNVGRYRVFDNLVTLAFEENRRNRFFKKELKKFLHLAQREGFNPRNVKGSYAGAIGMGQFMPSNYEAYGVDYDADGRITLQKAGDAIASVANYFKKNGWKKGEVIAEKVHYDGKRFDRLKTGYTTSYTRELLKDIRSDERWNHDQKIRLIKLNKKDYDELWFAAKNFFVITRYNHSSYYAMSVHQLAEKIEKKRDENKPHNGQ